MNHAIVQVHINFKLVDYMYCFLFIIQFLADIVACNRVDDTITALDAWTIASPSRDSRTDALQDVTLFNSSFVDGRITCT